MDECRREVTVQTVGAIHLAGGLARVGFVARFFARPVLEGFVVGLSLRRSSGVRSAMAAAIQPTAF